MDVLLVWSFSCLLAVAVAFWCVLVRAWACAGWCLFALFFSFFFLSFVLLFLFWGARDHPKSRGVCSHPALCCWHCAIVLSIVLSCSLIDHPNKKIPAFALACAANACFKPVGTAGTNIHAPTRPFESFYFWLQRCTAAYFERKKTQSGKGYSVSRVDRALC